MQLVGEADDGSCLEAQKAPLRGGEGREAGQMPAENGKFSESSH